MSHLAIPAPSTSTLPEQGTTSSPAAEMTDRVLDASLDKLIATLPAAVHEAMRKTLPGKCTPELAAQFAQTMAAELRAPSAEQQGDGTTTTPTTSPLAGLSIVPALVSGVQVAIACPAAWCTENHTGEDTKHLEDVGHAGAHVDVYVPHFRTGHDELFVYAHLAQDLYSKNPKMRAAYVRVEDGGGEESPMTPDQADTFADNLTVFADQIRTLARIARATDEQTEVAA